MYRNREREKHIYCINICMYIYIYIYRERCTYSRYMIICLQRSPGRARAGVRGPRPGQALLRPSLLYSTMLYYALLCSILFYSTLLYSALLCSALFYFALLCSALLYSALLYSALLYSTLLRSVLLCTVLFGASGHPVQALLLEDVEEQQGVIVVTHSYYRYQYDICL